MHGDDELARKLMTADEVAKLFRVRPRTIAQRVKRGLLLPPPVKGTKPRLFSRAAIVDWVNGGKGNRRPRRKPT